MSGKLIALLNPRTWRHDQFQNVSELRDQSIIDQSIIDQSIIDQSIIDQSIIDQSIIDQSIIDQSVPLINQFQINLAESTTQYMKTLARIGL